MARVVTLLAALVAADAAGAQFSRVGKPVGTPVGTQVGSSVGGPIRMPNGETFATPQFPNPITFVPQGRVIDVSQSIAPAQSLMRPQDRSFFQRLRDTLASLIPFSLNDQPQNTGYFPSLSRRSVERRREWFRR